LLGVTADWLSHAFIKLCKRAKIKGLHWHDLRREGISRLFEKGWSLEEVRAVSGHRTIQMLTVYSKLRAEDLVKKLA
jgi:integrase